MPRFVRGWEVGVWWEQLRSEQGYAAAPTVPNEYMTTLCDTREWTAPKENEEVFTGSGLTVLKP
jgi:hypothetical protein